MKPENAIEVRDLRKMFKVYYDKSGQIKERILFRKRNRYEENWVLDGISFDIKKGEAVGLIGHNGCGKSTTLKLLTKIIFPNSGTIEMCGRVSSLIELGAGFHPDLSGRENIYINASIFGLSRKEIDKRINEIIAFSELEGYIENPVRTYSSGMYARLAFSVAINVDADILLVDEILSVGDAGFQAKCFNKMKEIKKTGTTIVVVSHSLGEIERICDKTIWIHDGKIRESGLPRDVHPAYLDYIAKRYDKPKYIEQEEQKEQKVSSTEEINSEQNKESTEINEESQNKRWGNGKARINRICIKDDLDQESYKFRVGENIHIKVNYAVFEEIEDAIIGIGIFRMDGLNCYGTNTMLEKMDKFSLNQDGEFTIHLQDVGLLPSKYVVDLAIQADDGIPVDYYKEACSFEMYATVSDIGVCRINHRWEIK